MPLALLAGVPSQISLLPRCLHTLWKARILPSMSRDDDDGVPWQAELLGEVAAVARELLDPPDIEPRALEDRLALEFVELR